MISVGSLTNHSIDSGDRFLRERKRWKHFASFLRENGGPAGCANQFAAINPRGTYPGHIVYRRPGSSRPYLIIHKAS